MRWPTPGAPRPPSARSPSPDERVDGGPVGPLDVPQHDPRALDLEAGRRQRLDRLVGRPQDGRVARAARALGVPYLPITANMLVMGMVKNGAITFAYPEDAKRNLFVKRKQ